MITTVISNDVQRLGEISDAYKTAYGLLKTLSSIAAGQVINVSDTAQVSADMIRQNSPFGDEFRQKLQYADAEEADRLLEDVFRSDAGEQFNSRLMRYNALIDLVKITVQMTAHANPGADKKDIAAELSSNFDIINAAGSRSRFRKTAGQLVHASSKLVLCKIFCI